MVFRDTANAFGSLSHNLEDSKFLNSLVKPYGIPWDDKVHEAYSMKAQSWERRCRTVCEFGLKGLQSNPLDILFCLHVCHISRGKLHCLDYVNLNLQVNQLLVRIFFIAYLAVYI